MLLDSTNLWFKTFTIMPMCMLTVSHLDWTTSSTDLTLLCQMLMMLHSWLKLQLSSTKLAHSCKIVDSTMEKIFLNWLPVCKISRVLKSTTIWSPMWMLLLLHIQQMSMIASDSILALWQESFALFQLTHNSHSEVSFGPHLNPD